MLKKTSIIIGIFVIIIIFSLLFIKENLKYEINRDKSFKYPSGKYQITLRYNYASRPYIFKIKN